VDLGLKGRVALVMGASRGIGRGIAAAIAREGGRVAIASRSIERLAAIAKEIDGEVAPFATDATEPELVAALPGQVEAALGPIDILVTSAGGPPFGGALEHDVEEWERAYRSLVLAPRILTGAVVPGMRERGWGRILNVGSTATQEPIPGLNLSNAHRMAAVGFLKTLASEVAGAGITVNTIGTGRFATERVIEREGSLEQAEETARGEIPVGRLGRVEEYGDLAAFLCSDRAAYITGTVIPLDGGMLHTV
jgi:3-oxoacyl-[acyl-carrier protein] reductase